MHKRSLTFALQSAGPLSFYQQLSRSHKFIAIVFLLWLIQALPKWAVAITADGELSATIMRTFITPRVETQSIKPASIEHRDDIS